MQQRQPAYIVTGPTSGIGLRAALALSAHCVACDLAELNSVRLAAAAILA